jgi:hypothetical protein
MTMKICCSIFALCFSNFALAYPAAPPDVDAYVKNAELCEHLAGEWDDSLSKRRQKEIERDVSRYCGKAKTQLTILLEKYRDAPDVRKVIEAHAYDSVKDFQK